MSEEKNEWQIAVEDAMICWEMLPGETESPRMALNRLIHFEQTVALDPLVSEEAQALIKQGRNAAFREAVEIALNGALVPPDGGSPTVEETELCEEIAGRIRRHAGIIR